MISSQDTALSGLNPEAQLAWKDWKALHPELKRADYSTLVLSDKIIIIGGHPDEVPEDVDDDVDEDEDGDENDILHNKFKMMNIVILDQMKQSLKVLPPIGDDVKNLCWSQASICHWKDSKIIIFGGIDQYFGEMKTSVGIITLKDLDSENPSAHWEQVHPETKLPRFSHFAHIYQDKMYVSDISSSGYDIWCLDLETLKWKQCEFLGNQPEKVRGLAMFQAAAYENKFYVVPTRNAKDFTFHECDLDTLTWKAYNCSGLPENPRFKIWPQVDDRKIYVLSKAQSGSEAWIYDLDLQNWTQIKVANGSPLWHHNLHLHLFDNNLMVYGGCEPQDDPNLRRCWSLPINSRLQAQPANLTKIQQAMKQFLKEAPYSDISFVVESEIIPAHKWWLTKRSKYFANMFSSGMIEAQASKITITDMTVHAFKAFLEFLYSDHVELNEALALELLQQADKYSVADLKTACETYLATGITAENYVKVGHVAELVDAGSLRQAIVNYVGKYIKKLRQRKDFEQISDSLLRDSIVKFIVK